MHKPKVAIIGAGNVGMRYAYALMASGSARSIVIVDVDKARTEGEVLDLASGMPYVSPVEIKAGEYADVVDSDLVVITAGRKQKPGQSRLDLAKDNIELFKLIVPQLTKYAGKAIWLVVSNPVDVLSYAAFKLSKKPWHEVIGSGTVLDSARFRFLLGQHCHIDTRNIHAYILGEHGDSEFALWSKANIGGMLFKEYCPVCHQCNCQDSMQKIYEEVRDFAYRIIEKKGETSYGIGLALVKITEAILKDENSILPVSCYVQDYYGVSDAYMSLPAVVNKSGVRELFKLEFNKEEEAAFLNSAAKIKSAIKELGI